MAPPRLSLVARPSDGDSRAGRFDFFVGLAINDIAVGPRRARELVREWNGRMDRRIVGKQWLKRPDERIFSLYVLEKPGSNPHWHAFIRLEPPEPDRWSIQARKLTSMPPMTGAS